MIPKDIKMRVIRAALMELSGGFAEANIEKVLLEKSDFLENIRMASKLNVHRRTKLLR